MRFSEFHRDQKLVVSFELFPPKTPDATKRLFEAAIPELNKLSPGFYTCTYGAGGSTQGTTLEVVSRLKREVGVEAASHLTCVGASRQELGAYLDAAAEAGISNIVALRGDPPKGDTTFRPHPDGFTYGVELVKYIKQRGGFDVAVAGYPEGHPESGDKRTDWEHCARKVEAGADVIITQLFYDNADFFEYQDHLRNKLGVTIPIVPGVLPILNTTQIQRFCGMCGARLPDRIQRCLAKYADDNDACRRYGVELAIEMCEELIRNGVPGIHFYTLNRADSTSEIMNQLGVQPSAR